MRMPYLSRPSRLFRHRPRSPPATYASCSSTRVPKNPNGGGRHHQKAKTINAMLANQRSTPTPNNIAADRSRWACHAKNALGTTTAKAADNAPIASLGLKNHKMPAALIPAATCNRTMRKGNGTCVIGPREAARIIERRPHAFNYLRAARCGQGFRWRKIPSSSARLE